MLSLLGLPNETLSHIISYVMPDDIENFTRCCQHLYILGLPCLREHRKLKWTQSYLKLNSYQDDNGLSSVTQELCKIARNPRIAFYRTYLHYREKDYRNPVTSHGIVGQIVHIDDNRIYDAICENVTQSVYIHTDHRQIWYNNILIGKQTPAFALLLTLLPNLRKLDLSCTSFRSISTRLLDNVARSLHREENRPLSKLLHVTLKGKAQEGGREDGRHLRILALFAQLPSVRVLHGFTLEGGGFEKALWPADSSQVTDIDIAYSSIDGLCFSHFLHGFSNLRSFRLTVKDEESLCWDASAVHEALLMYTHRTLEVLDISIEYFDLEMEFGSLVDFEVLSVIRMDFGLFVEPKIRKTKRLVDMLPASVKSLTLGQEREFDEEMDLFAGLAELKHKRLPCLEEIIIYADQIKRHEISCCERLGISVVFKGTD